MKKKNDLTTQVMEKIEKGEVKMTPKIYFVLGSIMMGVGLAGVVFGMSFLTHLILFRMRVDRPIGMLIAGGQGMTPLIHFPWLMFGFFLLLTYLGVLLVQQYEFSYRRSLWGIVLAGMTFIVVLGCLIDRMGVERELQKVPHLRRIYGEQRLIPSPPEVRGFRRPEPR